MTDALTSLLNHKQFGAFLFNARLEVVASNAAADRLLATFGQLPPQTTLLDIFPELIGSEDQLEQIISNQKRSHHLDYINREHEHGQVRYLNLLLLACAEKDRGMLVVEDVTEKAQAVQVDNQQRYEQYLYRHSIESRRHQVGSLMVGKSAPIERIVETIHEISFVPSASVLLMGETGTGKNLTARMIHESSMGQAAPFIDINCAALPEQLIEAELFGYEKGSFTHAVSAKPGLMEEADGGTLFLDEIGELPLNFQSKLLSAIESKTFRRLGSTQPRKVNVRIIAATNRDLNAEIAAKRFREDLFYRLNVVSLTLPPLRELGEDIILIAEHFIRLLNIQFRKHVKGFSSDARRSLLAHSWPGNVRELSNCIERAMIFIKGDTIGPSDLVLTAPVSDASEQWVIPPSGIDLVEVERHLIRSALDLSDNNKSKAARLLGLTRHTLRYRMEKHKIE